MANRYDYGSGPGAALAGGVRAGFDAYDRQKDRQQRERDREWLAEQRSFETGLRPLRREALETSVEAGRFGLNQQRIQHQWDLEDRPTDVRSRHLGLQDAEFDYQQKFYQAKKEATLETMSLLKSGLPHLAILAYQKFDPNYTGRMPVPDTDNPGNWLLDLDGDGKLDSINPDVIINHYEPPKFQAPQQHPQLGLGQFGPDGRWHGLAQGADTERMRKIQGLVARGFDPNDAADLIEGRVRMTGPDRFGDVYLVNVTTGTRKKVGDWRGAGAGAADPGQYVVHDQVPMADPGGGSVPQYRQPHAPGADRINVPDIPPGGVQPSGAGLNLDAAAAEGTGPFAGLRQMANNVLGPFVTGQPFPDTEASRNTLRLFTQEAKQALVNSSRFPVYEQQLINNMLPDPGRIFADPDGQREKIRQLHRFLAEKHGLNRQELETSRLTMKRREELMNQQGAIERVLGMMGPPSERDTPVRHGGAQQGAPAARINSRQEYERLQPGTPYLAPDGTVRVKR